MVAFPFGDKMLKSFLTKMEDHGRMPSRVLQVLDHVPVPVDKLSLSKLDGLILMEFVVDVDEKQVRRIQSLLWKIYGMLSVEVQSAETLEPVQDNC
jgi:hypothetical protein